MEGNRRELPQTSRDPTGAGITLLVCLYKSSVLWHPSTNSPTSGSRAWLIRDTTCKMTSTLINTPLEKLNDQNYRSWKYI
ncbi:hypothetical protein LAZ67_13002450 [Cordylochernes scorpioides]|uniref:Uncharacterized protein n=1 Tax=Cordylochernes scorpioides TaxID=51811 RepID=A0ABY6L4K6_9ARAC|nr:hypothetical protein LAZ67_13002450 [Cordylochernes scorpioides]